jgi:hypothetical protein
MITNQDKIKLVIDRLNNVQGDINSYIEHADAFQSKYSLEDVLPECNSIKSALVKELESLGGVWPTP